MTQQLCGDPPDARIVVLVRGQHDREGGAVGADEPEGLARGGRAAEHVGPALAERDDQLGRVGPPHAEHRVDGARGGDHPDREERAR